MNTRMVLALAAVAGALLATPGCRLARPAAPIAEVVVCPGSGGTRRLHREDTRGDLFLVTADDAKARCNDGSPPGMYVRRGSPGHEDDWVVFLEGGGGCGQHATCRERFCTTPGKMSSDGLGDQLEGEGVFSAKEANPFHDYNAVVMEYCTSDDWSGRQAQPVELSGLAGPPYTLHFSGHDALAALLDVLDQGARPANGQALPSLRNARRILFTGSSAGGMGVMYNLEYVAHRYPQAKTVGGIDGAFYPRSDLFAPLKTRALDAQSARLWQATYVESWDSYAAAISDGGSTALETLPWLQKVLRTPVVYRADERDPVISSGYTAEGITLPQYGMAVQRTAEQVDELDRPDVSIVVSNCGQHMVLPFDDVSDGLTVDGVRYLDALWNMMEHGQKVVAIDDSNHARSVCVHRSAGHR